MAETWSKNVYSSNVSTVGYDEEEKVLYVTFLKGGAKYAYQGVPAELADNLANAPLVGSMLRTEIIPYYSGGRV